jgi:hypothetical protein
LHRLDTSHVHLELKGNLIHKDSDDLKPYQMESNALQKMKETYYKSQNQLDEYTDANGNRRIRMLKNEFNLIDRSTQTQTYPIREAGINTDPPSKIIFGDSVTQYNIFQSYAEDFEKQEIKNRKVKTTRIQSALPVKKKPKVKSLVNTKVFNIFQSISIINMNKNSNF